VKHRLHFVALLFLGACDPKGAPVVVKAPTSVVSVIPNPTIDPAAQKIVPELGGAYKALKTGRFDEVRRMVEQYVSASGASAHRGQAEFVVGLTYHRQNFFDSASEHFLAALKFEPGFLETYYYAGHSLFNVGRLEEARAAYAVYAKYKPDDHATAFGQGLVEIEADRIDDAERFVTRAIELAAKQRAAAQDTRSIDGDLGRYNARLGDLFARRDDWKRAQDLFEKAAGLRPDSPEIWSKLASACQRLGDSARAATARAKADEAAGKRLRSDGNSR